MDKFEQHKLDRDKADQNRIRNAREWLKRVQSLNDGSKQYLIELENAQEQLNRAYQEADYYNENQDEISQIRDQQIKMGKRSI